MSEFKLIKKITAVLKVLDSDTVKFKRYALDLAKSYNMIDETCKLY